MLGVKTRKETAYFADERELGLGNFLCALRPLRELRTTAP
jgi:hypothetical protein